MRRASSRPEPESAGSGLDWQPARLRVLNGVMARLSDDQVTARLAELPEWERRGDEIVRSYQAPSFLEGIAFVRRLAELAEAANHHPDIDIRWRTVRIALTTHDDGGLSAKDFALAVQIDDTFTVG